MAVKSIESLRWRQKFSHRQGTYFRLRTQCELFWRGLPILPTRNTGDGKGAIENSPEPSLVENQLFQENTVAPKGPFHTKPRHLLGKIAICRQFSLADFRSQFPQLTHLTTLNLMVSTLFVLYDI